MLHGKNTGANTTGYYIPNPLCLNEELLYDLQLYKNNTKESFV